MNTQKIFDLVIGLDRSDQKADLCLIDICSGKSWKQIIDVQPENLQKWIADLREQYPQGRIGLCLEQPAANLITFLEAYDFITLYPINPITLQKFREAFVTSRAKDDRKDAEYLAELLMTHSDKLNVWKPEEEKTRLLQQLVVHRRAVVDERTGLTNRLQALLKQYFPQALELCGDDLWRPLATNFLLKWPTLQVVKKAKLETLKQFYHLNGSRSQKLIAQRLEKIQQAVPLLHIAVRALAYKWQRIIWKCWHSKTIYKNDLYETALRKNGSPLVKLLDQITVGKNPAKNPVNKS